ncbi:DNA helicase [Vibrio phage VAP7]|uniref:Putative DNA helicase n=1 Tax=Vibrio phage VAP7 TaxID=2584487 RepID=A0A4Y5TVD7_9CAUD|nr:DNA helicase [Vibrio phage VAP7]QDB73344.1 putative DNA helicase [Vibrio phage VAP7]
MAYSLYLEKLNSSYAQVYSDEPCVYEDLYEYFKVKDPSYDKNNWAHRKWDGMARLVTRGGKVPIGLVEKVCKFARSRRYEIEVDPLLANTRSISDKELEEYIDHLNLSRDDSGETVPCIPWDYQVFGVKMALRLRRAVLLADTGAGKSLMQYILTRYYLDEATVDNEDVKVLIIVPSINLVSQMYNDFHEYSRLNGWEVDLFTHKVSSVDGGQKNTHKPVVITTWQSIQDMPKDYFKQFTKVITDEVHGARGNKIQGIMNACVNADDRAGLTGTLYEAQLHQVQVISLFGPTVQVADTEMLKKLGQVSETQIEMFNLNYEQSEKEWMRKFDYAAEVDAIMHHPYRNTLITTLCRTLPGNTLVMFERKEHIKIIYELLIQHKQNVFIINGDVDNDVRDQIKAKAENGENVTILASFGTMAVGVSVKKLHNAIFCHSNKSIVRTLQTVGRLLRRHKSKDKALIIDLVDNFKLEGGEPNKTLVHAMKRHGFYSSKKHPISFRNYDMKAMLPEDKLEELLADTKRRERSRKLKAERMKMMG